MTYFLIFIFGLIIGSFLNSVIFRLEKGEGFIFGRSYCPHCRQPLKWHELIPLISFFLLRGRCRHCSQKISWQYLMVELATGILFVLIFSTLPGYVATTLPGYAVSYGLLLIIASFLIIIFVYDLKHYLIPDIIVYPAIAATFVFQFLTTNFYYPILSAIGASAFFLAIVLISRGRLMGWGDVKLAALMGLFLGPLKILVALFLAFLSGAIIGLGLLIAGKKELKSEVPFGPFLVTGTFASLFWGSQIINWYLSLL